MGQKTGAFNDVQLVIAWVFTGLQLFAVAWFFDQITPFYAGMMLANSLIVTVLMAQRRPRRLHNLLPLAQRLFLMGLAGFFVSGTVAMLAPRSFVERYPFFLEVLSFAVAMSATLPATIFPFAVSLVLAVLFTRPRR
ncbi:MAG: hypothetical protein SVU69_12410 [Pseudomonadota bacterium]|nr:hypothetical protein [Pseudomonadota bacterium]